MVRWKGSCAIVIHLNNVDVVLLCLCFLHSQRHVLQYLYCSCLHFPKVEGDLVPLAWLVNSVAHEYSHNILGIIYWLISMLANMVHCCLRRLNMLRSSSLEWIPCWFGWGSSDYGALWYVGLSRNWNQNLLVLTLIRLRADQMKVKALLTLLMVSETGFSSATKKMMGLWVISKLWSVDELEF
jgi:hypothetical protein